MMERSGLFSILVFISILSPQAIAQPSSFCTARTDYINTCHSLTPFSHCSNQLTAVCCECQDDWDISFTYCQYVSVLNPPPPPATPTPTPTPTVIPTPAPTSNATPVPPTIPIVLPPDLTVPPIVSGDGLECIVRLQNGGSLCGDGRVELFINGSESNSIRSSALSFSWSFDCGSDGFLSNVGFINTDPSGKTFLRVTEPPLGKEIRCNVLLSVSSEPNNVKTCGLTALINNCSLGCSSYFNYIELTSLDKRAVAQLKGVQKLSRLAKRAGIPSAISKQSLMKAKKAYDESKAALLSIPVLFKVCTAQASCSSTGHGKYLKLYETNAKTMLAASNSLLKRLKKLPFFKSVADKEGKAAKSLMTGALKELALIPQAQSSCNTVGGAQ